MKLISTMKLALTGHRPNKLGGYGENVYVRLLELAMNEFVARRASAVISGMALGWDMAGAEAAILVGIPLFAYVPFEGQESQWPDKSKRLYRNLLKDAEEIRYCSPPGYEAWKMMHRNKCMIDDGDKVLALWNGDTDGGTYSAVKYAQQRGKEVINLWDTSWLGRVIDRAKLPQGEK